MLNLFRSGAVFFFLAGISFLLVALKHLPTIDGPEASGALVAMGAVWLVIGIAIRGKNAKGANASATETKK